MANVLTLRWPPMRQGACTPAQNIRAPAPESPEKISPYIRLARAFNHGLVQLQDKIAAHFAHAIYPYSLEGILRRRLNR